MTQKIYALNTLIHVHRQRKLVKLYVEDVFIFESVKIDLLR